MWNSRFGTCCDAPDVCLVGALVKSSVYMGIGLS